MKRAKYWENVHAFITQYGVTNIWSTHPQPQLPNPFSSKQSTQNSQQTKVAASQEGKKKKRKHQHLETNTSKISEKDDTGKDSSRTEEHTPSDADNSSGSESSVSSNERDSPLAENTHTESRPESGVQGGDMASVDSGMRQLTEYNRQILRQIRIDIPRTHCSAALLSQPEFKIMLERILFVWSIRHPAAGYVQGINDLLVPLLSVFLGQYFDSDDVTRYDLSRMQPSSLADIEADAYWCYTRFLDPIQDNYTFAQKGVQLQVRLMETIVQAEKPDLLEHLHKEGIEFLQFCFRWMNCILVREFPAQLYHRLLDAYFSRGIAYPTFHVYVCAQLLILHAPELLSSDFQGCMMYLQKLPTDKWDSKMMDDFLSQAFVLYSNRTETLGGLSGPAPQTPSTTHAGTGTPSLYISNPIKKQRSGLINHPKHLHPLSLHGNKR